MFRSFVAALVAATVIVAALCAADAHASGPRRSAALPAYGYGYGHGYGWIDMSAAVDPNSTHWYYPNPYVGQFPGYGIIAPPFATHRMLYGYDLGDADPQKQPPMVTDPENPPYKRPTIYPAVPFPRDKAFHFEIVVPTVDAVVLIGGVETNQVGLVRTYQSPPLRTDTNYRYSVEVRWTDKKGKQAEKATLNFLLGEPTKRLEFPLKN